ncbi:hypothetical protein N9933_02480 [bacterium]|nr:hypothetical protein [bacterium]
MKKPLKYISACIVLLGLVTFSPIRDSLTDILEVRPLSEKTIHILRENQSTFAVYAIKYNIPEEVIAASVGSEINRRIYINKITDFLQDLFFDSNLCSEKLLSKSFCLETENRYVNIVKQDIGLGNIKFETAWTIFKKYPEELHPITSKRDMVKYLLTNQGNIHIASLVIREAKLLFNEHCKNMDPLNRNAVFYSYYKQGDSYFFRYKESSSFKRPPVPGGGREILKQLNTTYKR